MRMTVLETLHRWKGQHSQSCWLGTVAEVRAFSEFASTGQDSGWPGPRCSPFGLDAAPWAYPRLTDCLQAPIMPPNQIGGKALTGGSHAASTSWLHFARAIGGHRNESGSVRPDLRAFLRVERTRPNLGGM